MNDLNADELEDAKVRVLVRLYDAFHRGVPVRLPPLQVAALYALLRHEMEAMEIDP